MDYTISSINRAYTRGPFLYSFISKSTFTKPTLADYKNMATGSGLYDLDTQTAFLFDAETNSWVIQ